MKKIYFIFLWLFSCISMHGVAGNILGGELRYSVVAPGVYVVDFRYVQDCSAITPPAFITAQVKSPSCNLLSRTVNLNKVGNYIMVTQSCANAFTPNCSPGNQAGNAFSVTYTGVITFTPSEQACQNWLIGVTVDANTRSASANLTGTPPIYLEAYINLRPGVHNNSVEYSPLNMPYLLALHNQPTTYFLNAAEADGDSLAFSFRPALQSAGSVAAYQPNYSFQSPIASNPAISITSSNNNGMLSFKPSLFVPNTTPAQGQNRYVTVVQVDEYRKIQGVAELVGSTQREMIIDVRQPDPTLNNVPAISNFTMNGQPTVSGPPVILTAGQPATVNFDVVDLDPLDMVRIDMDTMYFSNSGLAHFKVVNNLTRPQVEIQFTPNSGHAQTLNGTFYLPVRLEDNSCPVKAIKTELLIFQVQSALGTNPEFQANNHFQAVPNPFSHELTFKISGKNKPQTIVIYNLLGQEVDRLDLLNQTNPVSEVSWQRSGQIAAGTYVARLISADRSIQTLKFTKLQ